ncbi:MAG: rhodanese-like domain-containing protein [Deltaproteobacteria bacterium]|nr:rhodanese-like domain-containing protein [Deltaproteobacteria bacterium]
MPGMKRILFMAGLADVVCAFLLRPSALRAQGATGEYPNLSPAEARDLLGKRSGDPGFVLLDVRTRKEFDAERIAGAVIVDYNSPSFREKISQLDRSKPYLVYCRTGNRTNGAVKVMRELGFSNVSVFPGGITKWKEAGYPTTR